MFFIHFFAVFIFRRMFLPAGVIIMLPIPELDDAPLLIMNAAGGAVVFAIAFAQRVIAKKKGLLDKAQEAPELVEAAAE